MTCILLAAGYATRLYPLTKDFPKALLDVAGKTILDRVMENLEDGCEISRYVIVTNSRFAGHFSTWAERAKYSRPVTVLDDGTDTPENRLGAVGDLLHTIQNLGLDDDLFVMAVDYFVDFRFEDFIRYFREKDASCILRYEEHEPKILRKAANMSVDGEGRILRMEEKPETPFDIWCAPPFYLYARRDLPLISGSIAQGCPKDAPGYLAAWLSERACVYAMVMPGRHYDVGDIESYRLVQEQFRT